MPNQKHSLTGRSGSEAGQGLVEYALIILLVAAACVATVEALGTSLSTTITWLAGQLF